MKSHSNKEPDTGNSRQRYLLIALLTGFILSVWLGSRYFSQITPAEQLQTRSMPGNCDLRKQACQVNFDGFSITLDVEPRQIRSLTPLKYKVTVTGAKADNVMLDLQGTEMFMGLNQTQLTPVKDKDGMFTGIGELGACTTGEMPWRATLVAETDKGRVQTWFDFPAK